MSGSKTASPDEPAVEPRAKVGVSVPNFGDYGDPSTLVDLAVAADANGFDGFFLWDHIVIANGVAVADPWVALGAIALATERIVVGPLVTPLARRRPWVVARQATSVDHLSGGRMVLGVGLGAPAVEEFGTFGEPESERERALLLDEGLDVLAGMWSGAPFGYDGRRHRVRETTFAPPPVQSPTIPIWVAGMWPNRRPFHRAARYDGVFPIRRDMAPLTPAQLTEIIDYVRQHRSGPAPFEVVTYSGREPEHIRALSDAGATWVVLGPEMGSTLDDVRRMIDAGPPTD